MPSSVLQPVGNDFFSLRFFSEKSHFVIEIVPKKASFATPLPPPLHRHPVLPAHRSDLSDHWIIVGYTGAPPYLGKERDYEETLSFPLELSRYALPAVGALDINGEPVFVKNNRDVERFLAVKEAFEHHKYKRAYDLATEALELYPETIFASDFLRYKIKALFHDEMKEHADEIIRLGKFFIKRYASDEYLPEVLLLLARVYSATGFVSDANYFFNRLIQEHPGTKYANLGLIYLGDQFYINGETKKATQSYLQAYYNAKDLDVASLAAYKLAIRYLDRGEVAKGVEYLRKIWKRNPEFLLKDREDAHRLARQLAAHNAYDLAIEIDKALLERLKKLDDLYETILFEIGEWYDEKGDVESAIAWYERYLDEFAYGEFSEKARKGLDALFVVSPETNTTEALKRYDTLIREYGKAPIAQKALAAKVRLLVKEGRYDDAMVLEGAIEALRDKEAKEVAQKALQEAASKAFAEAVKHGMCQRAVTLVERYGVTPGNEADRFLYDCYTKFARYDRALEIAKRHLETRGLSQKSAWLCRALHALVGLGEYRRALEAAEEYKALTAKRERRCQTFDWDYFKALNRAGGFADEMDWIRQMAKRHRDDMRMADVFRQGYERAKRQKDSVQQWWLLRNLLDLQRRKGSHPYSPWAEFEAIGLLKSLNRFDEALKIAESMESLGLKGEDRARWLYETASLLQRAGKKEKARKRFEACAAVSGGGAWSRLCKEALRLQVF